MKIAGVITREVSERRAKVVLVAEFERAFGLLSTCPGANQT